MEPLSAFFNGKKVGIIALYEGFETSRQDRRYDVLKFYEEVWEMMEDDKKFEREMLRNYRTCRLPSELIRMVVASLPPSREK